GHEEVPNSIIRAFIEEAKHGVNDRKGSIAGDFGTSFFAEVCNSFPDSNVLVSPFSVYQALALVADGATASSDNEFELERFLGSTKERHRILAAAAGLFQAVDAGVQLDIASSIWANELKTSYIHEVQIRYSVESFQLPHTFRPVDDWIEEKTEGMIPGLMGDEPIDPRTKALIVSAVYYKGAWKHPFDRSKTTSGTFTLRNGTEMFADFMHSLRVVNTTVSPFLGGASVVILDYGNVTDFVAMFILPESLDDDSMEKAISGLSSRSISQLLRDSTPKVTRLTLPRFKLDFGAEKLKPILQSMGMNEAFNYGVDKKFDRMSNDLGLTLDDVYHGASMEVTEEGTETAAASMAHMKQRSVPQSIVFN
ncbi:hypothetical protein ACHAW6_000680, partial [Cyclotella cf. meneghiniana]